MHPIGLCLLLGFVTSLATAQPAPFVDVLHAEHPGAYYDEQAAGWRQETEGDCAAVDAWYQYYKAALYSNRFGTGTYGLPAILAAAEDQLPENSHYRHYLRFAADKRPTERWTELLRAYALDPDWPEAWPAMAAYYEVTGAPDKRDAVLQQLHATDPIPTGLMDYNYNQLMSAPEKGILLTAGDADTYPSWLLQTTFGVRPDVLVLNVALLVAYPDFRQATFERLSVLPGAAGEVTGLDLVNQLSKQDRPLCLAATNDRLIQELPKDKLYLTGLTFRYSDVAVVSDWSRTTTLQRKWRLERLLQPLDNSPAQAVADRLNQNYLPALLDVFVAEARLSRLLPGIQVRDLIETIARRAGREIDVIEYLNSLEEPQLASAKPGVTAKEIDKNLSFIPSKILAINTMQGESEAWVDTAYLPAFHAQETEVSNADYQLFLQDLLRQRKFNYIDSAEVAKTDWLALLPDSVRNWPPDVLYQAGRPDAGNHPIVNISHRAAELYALWLTQAYNADPAAKRRVNFRLSTAREFEHAARGGQRYAPYPWGGPYVRNAAGCWLANTNTLLWELDGKSKDYRGIAGRETEEEANAANDRPGTRFARRWARLKAKRDCADNDDGAWLTTATGTYFPNDYGLYNMSGNAAEMISEPGKIMGGSWLDPAEDMKIGVLVERAQPHPSTGFRLVMDVVN
ncbi:formylglycine-generating enzyme family protein [Neolewinella antarctica]|uniref:Formylglycine-generating enzyme required for sulfatase activity n=1 Tax=Neolewinella antarctica TaxID=442734 RepID=A0ABX0XEB2_9BACT|nr:SUMF1/EgtB/PvdO family nonheme iron enzyme [Neolewinella antarctica]NJC27092.1 formylglycine-generating enzyme required for sulfatase activity [Neolewinella antarctica]